MKRRTMSAAISANIELNRIVVELDRFGRPPTIRLEGHVRTHDPRVGTKSEAHVITRHLGKLGEQWINEMRDAFAASTPAAAD